ncbi:hypothetical protein [Chitinilyticum litopenaei]|uniref:hypothetical protein n=1 Tax=Chitinilyticum litopenaei TaxID=1121276 RepID=UPI0004097818|nr:hypothetical protein [Chitinilyticum litopenaei]
MRKPSRFNPAADSAARGRVIAPLQRQTLTPKTERAKPAQMRLHFVLAKTRY